MDEKYRFLLGTLLLAGLMAVAVAVALGKVEEKTSYGLSPLLLIFSKVALDFSEWAFRPKGSDKKDDKGGE